jgi:hypothetical protein
MHVRVTVIVSTDVSDDVPISIAARETSSTKIGDIPETVMTPFGSKPGHRAAEIALSADAIVQTGVHAYVVEWEWQARVGTASESLGSSRHEMYVLAGSPTSPWASAEPAGPAEQIAWPSALRLATSWANGAQTTDDAAGRIVSTMFELGRATPPKLKYAGNSCTYVIFLGQPAVFLCHIFITELKNDPTVGISCIDGSAVVTTFANLVGCAL